MREPLAGTRIASSPFLTPEDRRALVTATAYSRSVKSGIDLLREGDRPDTVFVIVDGWACRYTLTSDGGRQLPALLLPGDVGNLDSLMFDRLDYGVRTLTPATVLALSRDRVASLAAERPGIARTLAWLGMIENAMLTKGMLSIGRRSAEERLAHLLCELSVRLGAAGGTARTFDFLLTQEHVADMLGLTSVHVNRMMRQLTNSGLISLESRRMTIHDMARLGRLGGFDPRYLHLHRAAV